MRQLAKDAEGSLNNAAELTDAARCINTGGYTKALVNSITITQHFFFPAGTGLAGAMLRVRRMADGTEISMSDGCLQRLGMAAAA